MKTRRLNKWITITVAEPFPVFWGHVSQTVRRCGDPRIKGPFYAAGAPLSHTPWSPKNLAHAEWCAAAYRAEGYTATVAVVER